MPTTYLYAKDCTANVEPKNKTEQPSRRIIFSVELFFMTFPSTIKKSFTVCSKRDYL